VTFLGIGGLAPGADLPAFVEETGTGAFTHLDDESGTLYEQFGAGDRSTFLFVDDDGTFVRTTYGTMTEDRLNSEIEKLLES
jgi:hypothetical protein